MKLVPETAADLCHPLQKPNIGHLQHAPELERVVWRLGCEQLLGYEAEPETANASNVSMEAEGHGPSMSFECYPVHEVRGTLQCMI